jgi:hypothetical protein
MAGFDDPAFYGDRWAGQAGLRLAGRYAGRDRSPFGSASSRHVSVYQRA